VTDDGLQHTLLAAVCKRCGRMVAKYAGSGQQPPQWWRFARVEHRAGTTDLFLGCACDPAPLLPQGEQLEKLLARARRHDAPSRFRAPLKIRV